MKKLLLISMVTLVLAGCGFKPMYRADAENMAVTEAMATVDIGEIEQRLGQKVRNELLDIVTPLGEPSQPVYHLSIRLNEERDDVGLRRDASSTRANYRLQAQFRLMEISSEDVLIDGSTWANTGFDIVQSDYATLMAERAAQDRLAREIALEIRNRLAIYFGRDQ